MKILRYKTNITCTDDINAVTPYLDNEKTVENWTINIDNPHKILVVEGNQVEDRIIMETVLNAGFNIEKMP